MKKYKIIKNKKLEYRGRILFRIQALKDFGDVEKGDLGGWIEKEENLSQEGDCWVYGDAKVYGYALVFGDALVYGDARVFGEMKVSKTPINISGLQFGITISDNLVRIGCEVKTLDEWLKVSKKKAVGMGLDKENYKGFKTILKGLKELLK